MSELTFTAGDPVLWVLQLKKNRQLIADLTTYDIDTTLIAPYQSNTAIPVTIETDATEDTIAVSIEDTTDIPIGSTLLAVKLTSPDNVILRFSVKIKVLKGLI